MAIIVPSLPISGALPTASSSSLNIYPDGWKVNAAPAGSPAYRFWRDTDSNVVSQAIIDIVNNGTVVLFTSASSVSSTLGLVSSSVSSISSTFWPLSSSYYHLSSTFWNLSASLSTSISGTTGSITVWNLPLTGILTADAVYRFSWGTYRYAQSLGNMIGSATFDTTALSQSMYGDQVTDFGISGTVLALSSAFYGSDIPSNDIVSGALTNIAYEFLGVTNLIQVKSGSGGATGSHPPASYNNLREGYYALTQSFNALSSSFVSFSGTSGVSTASFVAVSATAASASVTASWALSTASAASSSLSSTITSFVTLSGNLDTSATLWNAAYQHVFSATIDVVWLNPSSPVYSINELHFSGANSSMSVVGSTATVTFDAPSTSSFNSLSSSFYALSGTYTAVSSAASSSAVTGTQLSGVLYPLSTSFYALSGTYAGVSGAASSSVATGSQLSGVLYPLSTSFYALSGTYAGVSGAASSSVVTGSQLSGVLYPLSSSYHSLSQSLDSTYVQSVYSGLYFGARSASLGPGIDVSMSLASGTWATFSGALTASDQNAMSASIQDGRIYSQRTGVYSIVGNCAIEAVGNPVTWNCHIGIFLSGNELPMWTTAMDMAKDTTTMLAVNAFMSIPSGSYIDFRVRADQAVTTLVTHHLQFLAHKL